MRVAGHAAASAGSTANAGADARVVKRALPTVTLLRARLPEVWVDLALVRSVSQLYELQINHQ